MLLIKPSHCFTGNTAAAVPVAASVAHTGHPVVAAGPIAVASGECIAHTVVVACTAAVVERGEHTPPHQYRPTSRSRVCILAEQWKG
jgi:hypothetical protein